MLSYIIRRLLTMIPMLLIICFLIFVGMELMPTDPISYMVGPEQIANMTPEKLEEMREALGLNRPFIVRFFEWLGGIARGDFGYSLTNGQPIKDIIAAKLPATIELSLYALLISCIRRISGHTQRC